MTRGRPIIPVEQRYERLTTPEPNSGCLLWLGGGTAGGYGHIQIGKKTLYAHRVAYERAVGPIHEGMVIDHMCNVPCCVNPQHMRVTTHRENILRSGATSAAHARKTHCPHGHEYTGSNLIVTKTGGRVCRECKNGQRRAKCSTRPSAHSVRSAEAVANQDMERQ